jgi:2-methylisocitrate lyase-like PEP mutase family enzyme
VLRSENYNLFLNIRTDTYLLGHESALQETLLRGQNYKAAGADGLFVPCLTSEKDISLIAEATGLPLNVMCMPDLLSFGRLKLAGVSRISMGNFVHSAIQSKLTDVMHAIRAHQTFEGLFVDEDY